MRSVKTSCLPNSTKNNDHVDTNNVLYSPPFTQYFLNSWCGLIPFWTSLHLGDQGRLFIKCGQISTAIMIA